MAAPATEGQFGVDITMASWKKAMKEMGFTDFYDVGLGGDTVVDTHSANSG